MTHYQEQREASYNYTTASQIRSDTLTLLLTYRMCSHLSTTQRMIKVKTCCEKLLARTTGDVMITTYCNIIKAIQARHLAEVAIMLNITENNYFKVYIDV